MISNPYCCIFIILDWYLCFQFFYGDRGLFFVCVCINRTGTGMVMPHWEFFGSTMVTQSYIRLTADQQSRIGGIYNKNVTIDFNLLSLHSHRNSREMLTLSIITSISFIFIFHFSDDIFCLFFLNI